MLAAGAVVSQGSLGVSSEKPAVDPAIATQTTVTQRDAQGNVVNVKQSQSSAQNPKIEENSDSSKRDSGSIQLVLH